MLKCKNCGKVVERPSHFSPVEGLKIKFKFEQGYIPEILSKRWITYNL